jgi:hypothetical protein
MKLNIRKIMPINLILERFDENIHLRKTTTNKHVSLGKHQETKLMSGKLQL